jgi:hypothetical protein
MHLSLFSSQHVRDDADRKGRSLHPMLLPGTNQKQNRCGKKLRACRFPRRAARKNSAMRRCERLESLRYKVHMNATRSCFSSWVSFVPKIKLKNSHRVLQGNKHPSCMYGGESLMPRKGKRFDRPVADGHHLVGHHGLKKRSVCRSCIRLWGVVRFHVTGRALHLMAVS